MTVRTFADLDALSAAAGDELSELARAAIAARGRFDLALSGGSTPKRLFQWLAARPGDERSEITGGGDPTGSARGAGVLPRGIDLWEHVHLWWGDERCVPPEHADSNYRMAHEALIAPLGLAEARVHRIHGELDPGAAARAYEDELAVLGAPPVLDYVMLGLGPDGHTASLFPDSAALDEVRRSVVANRVRSPLVPGGDAMRITLTAPAINRARHVRFLVAGADKAAALAAVIEGAREPRRYPAQLVAAADRAWLVDTAAAARLGGAG